MSKKQKSVALSTAEAEYIVASMSCCEVVWLWKLFSELFGHVIDTIIILCDDQSGIRLSENPVFHDQSKHIDIRYHFVQDMVQRGVIRLNHIGTDEQIADILTQPLGKVKFITFCEKLGIMKRPYSEGHAWVGLWAVGAPGRLGDSFLELQAYAGLGLLNLVVLLPHRYDIDLVYLSLIYAPHASYPWSFGLMGSTSHLANEVGNVDRDQ